MGRNKGNKKVERKDMKSLFVLDTSVVAKWYSKKDEEDLEKAIKLRESYFNKEIKIFIPDLVFYELSNVLRYNKKITEEDTKNALESLFYMQFEIIYPDFEIIKLAICYAYQKDITVYDSIFISVAKLLKAEFITADYKLYNKIKDLDFVKDIKDLEI